MGCDIHLQVEHRIDGVWTRAKAPLELMSEWDRNYHQDGIRSSQREIAAHQRSGDKKREQWAINSLNYHTSKFVWPEWYGDRNYDCFAILADVRNGRGFAGVSTGEGFNIIAEPKGLPDDLGPELAAALGEAEGGSDYESENRFWFGDHSHSWLTLKELLDFDWNQTTRLCGVVDWAAYEQILEARKTNPNQGPLGSYCGWITGPSIEVVDEENLNPAALTDPSLRPSHVCVWWTETYAQASGRFHSQVIPALQALDPDPENVRIVFGFDS